ncbi:MAG: biotin/lipoyl-binding protein, partial [Chloroflexi bacterium]|nr:biotin/lipoyl-binding protein [Chloroflexota bacterium]
MRPRSRRIALVSAVVLIAAGAIWYFIGRAAADSGPLAASGTIEVTEINISSELGGRVSQVNVREGDVVKAGDVLVQLDATLLKTQRAQAAAALAAASANYRLLKDGPATPQGAAQIAKAELELLQAQQALDDLVSNADTARAAAELEVANAKQAVYDAERHLNSVQYPDLGDYEKVFSDTLDRLNIALSNGTINDIGPMGTGLQAARDAVDAAHDRLGDVQTAEASCQNCDPDRLAKAQDNYNGALNNLQTLELQLNIAQTNNAETVRNAQDAVKDAEDSLAAAQAGPNARQLAIAKGGVSVAHARLDHALKQFDEVKDGPDPGLLAVA